MLRPWAPVTNVVDLVAVSSLLWFLALVKRLVGQPLESVVRRPTHMSIGEAPWRLSSEQATLRLAID